MTQLFNALAFYYEHRDEFEEREREAATTRRVGERRTSEQFGLKPTGTGNVGDRVE